MGSIELEYEQLGHSPSRYSNFGFQDQGLPVQSAQIAESQQVAQCCRGRATEGGMLQYCPRPRWASDPRIMALARPQSRTGQPRGPPGNWQCAVGSR
eukprot:9103611-Alexandrium_andersonii.AAC.1